MYGQLTAIAREFNFPSTAGVCLYLHHVDNGVSYTPRISDEVWAQLWPAMTDGTGQETTKSPICGRVEFDIDTQVARWYTAWLGTTHRPTAPVAHPYGEHTRGASQTTFATAEEEQSQEIEVPTLRQRPSYIRNVPKKLSLVNRMETRSPTPKPAPAPTEQTSSKTLSPITQVEEPITARHDRDLQNRVQSWRASARLSPTPLAATGQISLEPANMPNSVLLEDVFNINALPSEDEPLRLEDFQWSISSRGPPSDDMESIASPSYLPSVHLDRRAEGSVCLTPSVCTSFGPSDYTLSPLSEPSFRLPSPDIAFRMYEDMPTTPTTATSWGPASPSPSFDWFARVESDAVSVDLGGRMMLSPPMTATTATSWGPGSWPPSPVQLFSRPPSVDLGARAMSSRPATPSTATSWGAPESWPASPVYASRPASVDLGARGQFSCPPTPSTATSWGAPLEFPPSPLAYSRVPTPDPTGRYYDPEVALDLDALRRQWEDDEEEGTGSIYSDYEEDVPAERPWQHVWPYRGTSEIQGDAVPVESVYGDEAAQASMDLSVQPPQEDFVSQQSESMYEDEDAQLEVSSEKPWQHVWPYGSVGSQVQQDEQIPREMVMVSQDLDIPVLDDLPSNNASVKPMPTPIAMTLPYPAMNIYPAVYPGNLDEIYGPPVPAPIAPRLIAPAVTSRPVSSPAAAYPSFILYPAVYPCFDLYPALLTVAAPRRRKSLATQMSTTPVCKTWIVPASVCVRYPVFDLYPALYPSFNLYPAPAGTMGGIIASRRTRSIVLRPVNLTAICYPFLDIYPSLDGQHLKQPSASLMTRPRKQVIVAKITLHDIVYPVLTIYPALDGADEPVPSASRMTVAAAVKSSQARKTHQELHKEVLKTGAMQPKAYKSHARLHDEVLAAGLMRFDTRKSHEQLHNEVVAVGMPYRPSKSHLQLHDEMLASGKLQMHAPAPIPAPVVVREPMSLPVQPIATSPLDDDFDFVMETVWPPTLARDTLAPAELPKRASTPLSDYAEEVVVMQTAVRTRVGSNASPPQRPSPPPRPVSRTPPKRSPPPVPTRPSWTLNHSQTPSISEIPTTPPSIREAAAGVAQTNGVPLAGDSSPPLRVRSRLSGSITVPAPPPAPTRGLPPVVSEPQAASLPARPIPRTPRDVNASPVGRLSSRISMFETSASNPPTRTMSTHYSRPSLSSRPSLEEPRPSGPLRSSSMRVQTQPLERPLMRSQTSAGSSLRPLRKRDSLVLQRVNAINSGADEHPGVDLNDFPSVPAAQVPLHSRYGSR
ncbi:hypothetical protein CYLTODRAFT_256706 [Cylindrobasidium torrendii FP15055 ss-10]|uniref:Uncharacterized protein n=1 Tax=Cylindrobasidium torrendii FP15055 ss-10 TaxID=1314674 RepID=A0A0D7BSL6_9AGAR|nr:hypothetical protein CYLTODRAFT_256706 [Cylindrobasidium torrendii FP15055 ss-10]